MPPQGASAELEGLTGVWAAVKCLVSVGSSNVDLIKAHARCPAVQACQTMRGEHACTGTLPVCLTVSSMSNVVWASLMGCCECKVQDPVLSDLCRP